jgi:hypothetical protein
MLSSQERPMARSRIPVWKFLFFTANTPAPRIIEREELMSSR